ncbi:beta-ketoacyl-ACP synthase II [Caproiciproducens galactitolivorans]|uniref:3-oxoacyl-[acyl-carrier-protein] synthase 2 n=1 Tax=Caproiciproducens galactitolivorans TaxID=642589 RepID=A0A4Z0YCH1_9FIRM|nr:beta-ketoacyl-ACP synthase II [Caproiciproducens galactitolivorans]QEY35257.1 beta-ketoacyl-ACP synthase II [Caproiciproducens galactitolivorans]TGJ76951.1 3-oxoacyl-[acyl-carrier-protein] synthase 2 [Caproiciproducens galactitolivorans]
MRRVVVTGLGVVSPVGNAVEAFWNNLIDGKCGIGFITRFDTADFKVKIAAEVKGFDPQEYMEKAEIRKSDLFTQYAMAAASQAMADSGIAGTLSPERLGVYVGSGIGGMDTFIKECDKYLKGGPRKVSPLFVPMMIANMASGNIAIKYNAQGPCLPVVTACATSTHALGEAFRTVKGGHADAVIAGGAEAAINPLSIAGFTNCMALSTKNLPEESSLPFDKRRDGFVMGEGAGILILEEYEHAKARGAKIYAEICGYGNTCDAHHITAPHPEAVGGARAISFALEEAGYQDKDEIYINAHGTGTPLNDKSETIAIKKALGDKAYRTSISSTKSMTGHMLGAAGAVEAISSVLALKHGVIPPTIGLQEKDPDCDLDYTPNTARKKETTLALSVSLGFGGHNACIAFRKYTGE